MPKLAEFFEDYNKKTSHKDKKSISNEKKVTKDSLQTSKFALSSDKHQKFSSTTHSTKSEVASGPDDEQFAAAVQKFHDAHAKRVREHGPRLFRWPDGSLQPHKPPPSPFTISNRNRWMPLVEHCRVNGGERAYETTGHSFRYGLGVTKEQHISYLKQAELEPETRGTHNESSGEQHQADDDPLKDPHHAFNSYYKEQAAQVFSTSNARGRLL